MLALFSLSFSCASVAPLPPAAIPVVENFGFAPPDLSDSRKLHLWATFYSIPRVRSVTGGHVLLDRSGNSLGVSLSTRDFCDAAMEGTVQILAGARWRTYNYAGLGPHEQVDCSARYPRHRVIGRSRFRASDQRFGEGALGGKLIPFRTIAVDPRFIPYRTLIFIPGARGATITLPDGEKRTHDGYFFAADTGGAIKGPHIDVFLGVRGENPFRFIGSKKSASFEAYVIEDADLRDRFAREHELDRPAG